MMNQLQYSKIKTKLGMKNCPLCGKQTIYCAYNRVNIFSKDGSAVPFEDVNIPNEKYINFECPMCGYTMKINLEKLLK